MLGKQSAVRIAAILECISALLFFSMFIFFLGVIYSFIVMGKKIVITVFEILLGPVYGIWGALSSYLLWKFKKIGAKLAIAREITIILLFLPLRVALYGFWFYIFTTLILFAIAIIALVAYSWDYLS